MALSPYVTETFTCNHMVQEDGRRNGYHCLALTRRYSVLSKGYIS